MMENVALELMQRLAGSILHFVWQGSLLAAVAAIGLRLFAHRSPEFRYTFAVVLLFGMLAAPLLTFLLYAETGAFVARLLRWVGRAPEGSANTAAWVQWIVSVWVIGVSTCSIRLLAGWRLSLRLIRTATAAEETIVRLFEEMKDRLAVTAPVRLLISARIQGPAAIGWLRPVVLLPVSALSGLDEGQLSAVFAHELAHIRRHDFFVNVLQRCVETVLFYHPAVWWLSSRVRREREHCADDLAARACGDPLLIARALMQLEQNRAELPFAAVGATGGAVERVERLLGHETKNLNWQASAVGLLIIVLWVVAGAWQSSALQVQQASLQLPFPAPPANPVAAIAAIATAEPVRAPQPPQQSQPPSGKALLEQARGKKAAGDLQGAMELLEGVVAASDRNAVAGALLEMASIAESLDQLAKARSLYERVQAEFKDQPGEAAIATARLAARSTGPARIAIPTLHSDDVYSFAISPDGRTLVFQGVSPDGKRQLWRQAVDASQKPEPIAGTEGAGQNSFPFFAPDGKSIAFFMKQKLWQIDLAGGAPKELADAPTPSGGDWKGGSILMSGRGLGSGIDLIENGRTKPAIREGGLFMSPKFIDDRRFLYFARDRNGGGEIALGSLDTGGTVPARGLLNVHAAAFSSGFLVFVTEMGTMNAVQFDPNVGARGVSMVLANSVGKEDRYHGIAAFAVSAEGTVAYREAAVLKKQMMWMDRTGALLGTIGSPDSDSPSGLHLSPDGRSVLYFRQAGTRLGSIWALDTTGIGESIMLESFAAGGLFSPAGDQILFANMGQAGGVVNIRPAAGGTFGGAGAVTINGGNGGASSIGVGRGGAPAARAVNTPGGISGAFPDDWGSNGFILYHNGNGGGMRLGGDLWALPPNQGSPILVAQSPGSERNGRFSPDSNWVAYQSDESGRDEIYALPFKGAQNQRQRVSLGGGSNPQWGRGGRELFFLGADNRLMVVSAEASINGENRSIEFGTPKPVFSTPLPPGSEFDYDRNTDRFLFLASVETPAPIIVLSKWMPAK